MSWWSDGERCDEYDDPWCENCKGTESKAQCDACYKAHTAIDEEEPIEEELAPLPAYYEEFLKKAHKTTPYAYYFDEYNFCPNCGADMRERKESE